MKQTCFLEEPAWMAVSRSAPNRDELWDLLDLGTRLPGILERANIAMQNSEAVDLFSVASELLTFLTELEAFTRNPSYPLGDNDEPIYDIESFPTFAVWVDGDRTFPYAFDFADWRQVHLATQCELYGAMALNTLFCFMEADLRHNNLPLEKLDDMQGDLDGIIDRLCCMLPALIGLVPSSMGMISCSPVLRLAIVHFEKRGMYKKLKWAEKVAARLHGEGIAFAGAELW